MLIKEDETHSKRKPPTVWRQKFVIGKDGKHVAIMPGSWQPIFPPSVVPRNTNKREKDYTSSIA